MKKVIIATFTLFIAFGANAYTTFSCDLGGKNTVHIRHLEQPDVPEEISMTTYIIGGEDHYFYRPTLEGDVLKSDLMLSFKGVARYGYSRPVGDTEAYVFISDMEVERMLHGLSFQASFEFINYPGLGDFSAESECRKM